MDGLLEIDRVVSEILVVPEELHLRPFFKILEYAAHGFPWLICSFLAAVVAYSANWEEKTQFALLILNIALLVDVAIVGALKVTVRRRRPVQNIDDQFFEAPIADQFSFPSGHSSRASMLASLCGRFCPWLYGYIAPLPYLLALSRVNMGRHYLSDVIAGLILGCLEAHLVSLIPFSANRVFRRIFI